MKFESYASNQIYKYAKSYDIKTTAISYADNLILLEYKGKKELIKQTATRFTNLIQGRICDNKFLATQYLRDHGIDNIPKNMVIEHLEELQWHTISYPVVVKPLKWHWGKGISIWIKNKKELNNAFQIAKKVYYRVLVEEYISWDDYRILVVNKHIFATKRIAAHVIWDWKTTIAQLIEKENSKRWKNNNVLVPIRINQESIYILKKQHLKITDIPKKGVMVFLRENANLSTWGSTIDYTDNIHIQNKKLALKIAKIMNMKIIAIDFLFKDPTKPYSKENGIVIEINDTPWIRLHHPREQTIIYHIFKLLFPNIR